MTVFLDSSSSEVRDLVRRTAAASPRDHAVNLYSAVRDGIRYEVYGADLSREGLRASQIIRTGSGMCLHKSIVYAAALRAAGIPSRLVLTDVRNHLASPRHAAARQTLITRHDARWVSRSIRLPRRARHNAAPEHSRLLWG
jgi:transglutaminase-like putative cysteine protease